MDPGFRGNDNEFDIGCLSRLARYRNHLRIGEFEQAFFTQFRAKARLLMSGKRRIGRQMDRFIDPYCAGFELLGNATAASGSLVQIEPARP